jgi:DNA-binding transcriptional regulator GbsR (MarR family)
MSDNNNLSLLGLELNKANIDIIADQLASEVKEGWKDASIVCTQAKYLQKVAESVLEKCEQELKKEIALNNNKISTLSIEISEKKGYAQLDYESDEIYLELKNKLTERKKELDLARKTEHNIVDNDGVVIPRVDIKGYTKDAIVMKLK